VALALASKTPGLGLGLDHVVLEHIPAMNHYNNYNNYNNNNSYKQYYYVSK